MFLAIEAGLVVLALALAFTVPNLGSRWFATLERTFGNLARQRRLSIITVGLSALSLRAALLPILPVPVPGIGDEFGYLLLSDTFAHGRLTNPTSPMWMHFESLFVIWRPTHTAIYYPAQGLFMAVGQALLGHPFWGIWLSVGIMCAAITWMLQGWLTPGWALLGGFLAVVRFGAFNYWANSYWGGAVAAIGGALVLGALPRLKQQKRARHALLMGFGFAIMANSRPYEGLFFGIPVAIVLLAWVWKLKRPELGRALKRVVVPLLAVLALTVVAMGYYFWRTTGSPLNTPYLVYERAYNPVPFFPWQSMRPFPHYSQPGLRQFYLGLKHTYYDPWRTIPGFLLSRAVRLAIIGSFYLGAVLALPLLLVPMVLPYGFSWKDLSSNTRVLMAVSAAVVVANMLPIYYLPHYTAPITCVIFAAVLIALRRVWPWQWRGKPVGRFIARSVPTICLLMLLLRTAEPAWPAYRIPLWCTVTPTNQERSEMLEKLQRMPGRQLVIVQYGPDHDVGSREWVYNRADMDSAKVIWAHDMGAAENHELIDYFKGRNVWLVDADSHPPKLEPYPSSAGEQSAVNADGEH
jgi:hypothetical protein